MNRPTLPGIAVSPVALAADVGPVLVGPRRAPQSARRVRHRGAGTASERSSEFSGSFSKILIDLLVKFEFQLIFPKIPSTALLPVYEAVEDEGEGAGDAHLRPAGHGDAAVRPLAGGHPAAVDDNQEQHSRRD